jgi:hypothetical protein
VFKPFVRPEPPARRPFEHASLPFVVNARHPPAIAAEDDMSNFGRSGKLSGEVASPHVPDLQSAFGRTAGVGTSGQESAVRTEGKSFRAFLSEREATHKSARVDVPQLDRVATGTHGQKITRRVCLHCHYERSLRQMSNRAAACEVDDCHVRPFRRSQVTSDEHSMIGRSRMANGDHNLRR